MAIIARSESGRVRWAATIVAFARSDAKTCRIEQSSEDAATSAASQVRKRHAALLREKGQRVTTRGDTLLLVKRGVTI